MIDKSLLARVCGVLNRHSVKYAVAGGYACALSGHIRMTEDIDIPFLGLETLIKSKETFREIDQWDIKVLKEIQKKMNG